MGAGSNKERNTFVREQITRATMALLEEKDLRDISISEIIQRAQVGRASFYRNYTDKENIIKAHIQSLHAMWYESGAFQHLSKEGGKAGRDDAMIASLFGHMYENRAFYLLLQKRGLLYLVREMFREIYGPRPEYPNLGAYSAAFIFYGLYGWIEEWVARGMQESADEMAALLAQRRAL